jgi:hypothetical protein
MRATRVAVLAAVHGNAQALAAVPAEALAEELHAIVHHGDLTRPPLPEEAVRLLHGRDVRDVRGVPGRTFCAPGSAGMPYEGGPGACSVVHGPHIDHRRVARGCRDEPGTAAARGRTTLRRGAVTRR